MAEFKREDRYVVLKRKDLERLPVLLQETLWGFLEQAEFSLPKRQYVVVESDWPEYETVFKMIESRVNGKAVVAPARCEYCDDTGDVHGIDGEWRGTCTCAAGAASVLDVTP